ncbi:MAG: hypothetical protein GY849_11705, partial [Deltaproteobacteria bacterium]|nr:hypothetical protein [Deltaproteobacteria bacterium]
NVFSTTYQPVFGDPCNPGGTGRIYAIDYSWGTHVFNFYLDNDIIDEEHYDVRDTYMEILDTPIPSGVRPYFRGDKVGGFPTFGGRIPPMGPEGTTIPGPPGGVSRMIWEAR